MAIRRAAIALHTDTGVGAKQVDLSVFLEDLINQHLDVGFARHIACDVAFLLDIGRHYRSRAFRRESPAQGAADSVGAAGDNDNFVVNFHAPSISTRVSASILNECAQAAKSVVPLLGNQIEVMAGVFQAALLQLPNALAAVPCAAHQTRALHHSQMFGDGLSRDLGTRGQPSDRHGPMVTEPEHKA
jgi:hypothetical protein